MNILLHVSSQLDNSHIVGAKICVIFITLQWRHNERDGVWNHQLHDSLFNRLFKAQIKENINVPRLWPLWGEFTGDRWFPLTEDH